MECELPVVGRESPLCRSHLNMTVLVVVGVPGLIGVLVELKKKGG